MIFHRPAATKVYVLTTLGLFAVTLLTGCGFGRSAGSVPAEVISGGKIVGKVFGGQQPVAGAHVYLMAAGTTGYGAASTSLLTTATTDSIGSYVLSGADGGFNLSGNYTCTAGTQVYAYALGGDSGGGNNSMIGLLAVLGNCPSSGTLASQVPNFVINEVSTVAAAYALAGYAVDATHISSSGTAAAQVGIANAAANAFQLNDVSSASGALATTPVGDGAVPQLLLNSLGDILAACINSPSASSAPCTTIETNAAKGTTQPTDTATAAINIAHQPAANVSSLFALSSTVAPFQPSLPAQPADFSVTVTYPSIYLVGAAGIAIDQTGDPWVTSPGSTQLLEFSPLGAFKGGAYAPGYIVSPRGVAILPGGDVIFTDNGTPGFGVYDPAANTLSNIIYNTGSPVFSPFIAVNKYGFYGTSGLAQGTDGPVQTIFYDYSGTNKIANAQVTTPYAEAADGNDFFWVTSNTPGATSGAVLEKYKYDGTSNGALETATCTGTNYAQGTGVVIDSAMNVWVSDFHTGRLVEFANSCSYIADYPTISAPTGLAIDGNNTLWTVNGSNRLGATTTAGVAVSPAAGYTLGVTGTLLGPVVDGSGDVWLANSTNNTLHEVIGIATPVVTPLAVAVQTNKVAQRP